MQMKNLYFFETKYLNILHQNIAGLLNKSDFLQIHIEELKENHCNVDIICITEHFMMAGYETQLNLPDYKIAACYSRSNIRRGGACILIRQEYTVRELLEVKNISLVNIFECCAIELVDFDVIIICVYRVPKSNNINTFLT